MTSCNPHILGSNFQIISDVQLYCFLLHTRNQPSKTSSGRKELLPHKHYCFCSPGPQSLSEARHALLLSTFKMLRTFITNQHSLQLASWKKEKKSWKFCGFTLQWRNTTSLLVISLLNASIKATLKKRHVGGEEVWGRDRRWQREATEEMPTRIIFIKHV